jgi:hypothetical protein
VEKARKNIFEQLSGDFDTAHEIKLIWDLFTDDLIRYDDYKNVPILDCIYSYSNSFQNWKSRGRCVSPNDMMVRLGIKECMSVIKDKFSNEMLTVLEFILNMIKHCDIAIIEHNLKFKFYGNYKVLKENINILLEHFGQTIRYFEDDERVLIIEKNPAAISAAEISEPEIAKRIIQYNHHALKGDIEAKKDILLALANEIEPKREDLKQINGSVESDLFLMFNNLNLRHNNIDPNDKNYKPFIAGMNKNDLELWYDDTYQMILLAKLLLDNKERQSRIKTLKGNL